MNFRKRDQNVSISDCDSYQTCFWRFNVFYYWNSRAGPERRNESAEKSIQEHQNMKNGNAWCIEGIMPDEYRGYNFGTPVSALGPRPEVVWTDEHIKLSHWELE